MYKFILFLQLKRSEKDPTNIVSNNFSILFTNVPRSFSSHILSSLIYCRFLSFFLSDLLFLFFVSTLCGLSRPLHAGLLNRQWHLIEQKIPPSFSPSRNLPPFLPSLYRLSIQISLCLSPSLISIYTFQHPKTIFFKEKKIRNWISKDIYNVIE